MPKRNEATPDLAAQTGDALVAISGEGRLLRLNPMAEKFLRTSGEAAAGKPCREVLRSSLCTSACPLETGKYATHFNVRMKVEGEETAVCIVCTPLRDESGRTTGVVESIRDVRQVVRLIEERDEAAAWWRAIVDTVNDGLIATDKGIRITGFNRAAEEITGWKREEVLGRSCKEVLSAGFCPLEETLVNGAGLPGMEMQMRTKDGRKVAVWLTTELLRTAEGAVMGAVQRVRPQLEGEQVAAGAARPLSYAPLVGESVAMRTVYDWIDRLAGTDSTVLLTGESGTGKELVAELLHYRSARSAKPLVRVNCAALPETLLESELFGHVRGAFTGAIQDRPGRFELAHRGTLFLDEIGDLPLSLQSKLLRVLQDRVVERLGSGRPSPVDFRVIAATNRDLPAMIASGSFRQDLYYRLAVVPVRLPPLREHLEDVPALVDSALRKLAGRLQGRAPQGPGPGALELLRAHSWPGNVRELENVVEYAAIHCRTGWMQAEDLPAYLRESSASGTALNQALRQTEREMIVAAVRQSETAAEAARKLGMSRATLFRKAAQYGLHLASLKS